MNQYQPTDPRSMARLDSICIALRQDGNAAYVQDTMLHTTASLLGVNLVTGFGNGFRQVYQ